MLFLLYVNTVNMLPYFTRIRTLLHRPRTIVFAFPLKVYSIIIYRAIADHSLTISFNFVDICSIHNSFGINVQYIKMLRFSLILKTISCVFSVYEMQWKFKRCRYACNKWGKNNLRRRCFIVPNVLRFYCVWRVELIFMIIIFLI